MFSFLLSRQSVHTAACLRLDVKRPFEWLGYSLEDWESDFKTKIAKIEVLKKKAELADLETRLDKLVSPERKAELELQAIAKALES